MNTRWMSLILLGLVAVGGCRAAESDRAATDTGGAPASDQAPPSNALRVPEATQKKWGIELAVAGKTTMTGTMTIPGVLGLDPRRTAQVSSLLDGQVTYVGVKPGDEVRAGQVLLRLHAPSLSQAKTAFLQAASRLDLARQEFDRAEALLKQEAIDRKEHLRRQTELANATSEFDVAESNLHSYGLDQEAVDRLRRESRRSADEHSPLDHVTEPTLNLASPMAGRVVAMTVVTGQHVEPQHALVTIADLSTLWALLDAREQDLPYVTPGREVRITTTIYPDRVWTGKVDYVGDIVDEKTRTVQVRIVVPNTGRLLKPNMYIQGELPDAVSATDVVAVPQDAVQTIGGDPVVFVREGPDLFVVRPVELGGRIGDARVIARGLEGSERIVVAGAFNLKAELLKSTLAGE